MSNKIDDIFRKVAQEHEEKFIPQDWNLMQQKLPSPTTVPVIQLPTAAASGSMWGKWLVGFVQGIVFMGAATYMVSSVRNQSEKNIIAKNDIVAESKKELQAANEKRSNHYSIGSKSEYDSNKKLSNPSNFSANGEATLKDSLYTPDSNGLTQSIFQESDIFQKSNDIQEVNPITDNNVFVAPVNGTNTASILEMEMLVTKEVAKTEPKRADKSSVIKKKQRNTFQTDMFGAGITLNINPSETVVVVVEEESSVPKMILPAKSATAANKKRKQNIDNEATFMPLSAIALQNQIADSLAKDSVEKRTQIAVIKPNKVDSNYVKPVENQQQEENHQHEERFAHVGFVPALSSNGLHSGKYENKLSVHVLVGHSAALSGFEASGIGNIETDYVKGVQMAGVFCVAKNDVSGVQASGFGNYGGNVSGVQAAGVVNVAQNVSGVQASGFGNFAKEVNGVQAAGVGNIAKNVKGVQAAGLFNVAKRLDGWQIGLLNFTDTVVSGGGIGLLSYSRKSPKRVQLWSNQSINFNLGIRFTYGKMYSIAAVGINMLSGENARYAIGYGFGSKLKQTGRATVNSDLMYFRVLEDNLEALEGAGLAQWRLNVHLHSKSRADFVFGPALYFFHSDEYSGASLSSLTVLKNRHKDNYQRVWLGLNVGLEF